MVDIPWTEPMEVVLLELIVGCGLHTASEGDSSSALWAQVNSDLFVNAPFIPYKKEHYDESDYRRLSDKFRLMKDEAVEKMGFGSVTAFTGELSRKFNLLKQAIEEGNRADLARQWKSLKEDEEKERLQDARERTRRRDKGAVVLHLDETVSDHRISKHLDPFPDYMLERVIKKSREISEAEIQKSITQWVSLNNKTVYDLMVDVDLSLIPLTDVKQQVRISMKMVEAVGLTCLLSVYCQRDMKFSLDSFSRILGALSIHMLLAVKMFCVLENWRALANESITIPPEIAGGTIIDNDADDRSLFMKY